MILFFASCDTKQFTAALIMKLAEGGELALDDPVSKSYHQTLQMRSQVGVSPCCVNYVSSRLHQGGMIATYIICASRLRGISASNPCSGNHWREAIILLT